MGRKAKTEVPQLSGAELALIQLLRQGHGLAEIQQIAQTAQAPAPKVGPHVFDAKWKTTPHTCPKCKKSGMVDPDFGMRLLRGKELKQSWCVACRATTNYHGMPRLAERKAERERRHGR